LAKKDADSLEQQTSLLLKDIEPLLGTTGRCDIKVPAGVVPTASSLRTEYSFIKNQTLLRNVTYALQSIAFYRWILRRFSLYGPVKSYIVKTGLILIYMLVEGMLHDFLEQKGHKPGKKIGKNIRLLKEKCGIRPELCSRIQDLHDRRANIHLHLVTDLENDKYTATDWNKAIATLKQFAAAVKKELSI